MPASGQRSYRGVRRRQRGKWTVEIHIPKKILSTLGSDLRINKQQLWVGSFDSALEAALAYGFVYCYFRRTIPIETFNHRLNFPEKFATPPSFPPNATMKEILRLAHRFATGGDGDGEAAGLREIGSNSGVTELGLSDEEIGFNYSSFDLLGFSSNGIDHNHGSEHGSQFSNNSTVNPFHFSGVFEPGECSNVNRDDDGDVDVGGDGYGYLDIRGDGDGDVNIGGDGGCNSGVTELVSNNEEIFSNTDQEIESIKQTPLFSPVHSSLNQYLHSPFSVFETWEWSNVNRDNDVKGDGDGDADIGRDDQIMGSTLDFLYDDSFWK